MKTLDLGSNDPQTLRNLSRLLEDKALLLEELKTINDESEIVLNSIENTFDQTPKEVSTPVVSSIIEEEKVLFPWQIDLLKEFEDNTYSDPFDFFEGNKDLSDKNKDFLLSIQKYATSDKYKYLIPQDNPIKGFKGFKLDKKTNTIKCRQTDYGDVKGNNSNIPQIKTPINLCSNGYHFCKELIYVDDYYNFSDNENVYYEVEAWGEIHFTGSDKIASQSLKIGKPLSKEEMDNERLKRVFKKVDEIIKLNSNLVISGSLALILLGLIPYREIGDLDFTLPYFQPIGKEENFTNEFGNSGEECYQFHINGEKIDVFLNPTISFTIIEKFGKRYKISNPTPIINAKWRYFLAGKSKHGIDLINYIKSTGLVKKSEFNSLFDEKYTSKEELDWE